MRFRSATVVALAVLTEALDEPAPDLAQMLDRLGEAVSLTVTSLIALSIRTGVGDAEIELTARAEGRDAGGIRTSLLIPLPARAGGGSTPGSRSSLLLYAGQPGAFVDLAADISWITGRALDAFPMDEHLGPIAEERSAPALRELSMVNQAVGVLIERGFLPEEAVRHLDRLVVLAGTVSAATAGVLLSRRSDAGPP